MMPVTSSARVLLELRRLARGGPEDARSLASQLFDLHRVHLLRISFHDDDRETRARDADVLAGWAPAWQVLAWANEILILSTEPVSRSSIWPPSFSSPAAVHQASCVHFDRAALDAILELLGDGAPAVREQLASQLATRWDEVDDRDGRIYEAVIAGITDPVLQPSALRIIKHVAASRSRETVLKRDRQIDPALRQQLRKIALGDDDQARWEAAGAIVAIGDLELTRAIWSAHTADARDPDLAIRTELIRALADSGRRDELEQLRSVVADSKIDVALRLAALRGLQERRQAGRAARYERELEEAFARRQETIQKASDRAARARRITAPPTADAADGTPVRAFRHSDGRTWKVRIVFPDRVQLWIGLPDGDVIERTRSSETPGRLRDELIAAQIGEGFVEEP